MFARFGREACWPNAEMIWDATWFLYSEIRVIQSVYTITHFDDELDFGDVSLAIPVGAVGHFNEGKCGRRE
jgi:hypothetical protein